MHAIELTDSDGGCMGLATSSLGRHIFQLIRLWVQEFTFKCRSASTTAGHQAGCAAGG